MLVSSRLSYTARVPPVADPLHALLRSLRVCPPPGIPASVAKATLAHAFDVFLETVTANRRGAFEQLHFSDSSRTRVYVVCWCLLAVNMRCGGWVHPCPIMIHDEVMCVVGAVPVHTSYCPGPRHVCSTS